MNEIPLWLSFVTAVAGIGAGYRYGKRLHRHGFNLAGHVSVNDCPLIPMALLLFVLLQVCASTLLRNPQIGWILPLPVEYYLTPALWMLKLFFVAFAMAAVAGVSLLQRHAARHLIVVFTLVVVLAVEGLNRWAVQPNLGDIEARIKDGVILQTNPSTCAAASAANVAVYFGIAATEAEMVEVLNTTWAGTAPSQIVYGLRSLGLEARKVYQPDRDLGQINPPAILLVDHAGEPDAHAVAYMRPLGGAFEIWDPNHGRLALLPGQVRERWRGRAVEVHRPE